jgi:hypothetical protein
MRRSKAVALIATGAVIGTVLAATPAGAHVGGTVAHLWTHLRPKADMRYLPASNLPPGKTMKGVYALGYTAPGADVYGIGSGTTFLQQLPSAPAVHYVPMATTPPSACPGTDDNPKAAPGHLCIYEAARANVDSFLVANPTTNTAGTASRWGFYVQLRSIAAGLTYSNGSWAVTAPSG